MGSYALSGLRELTPIVPNIMHAKRPTCQRNMSVQNGSSAEGPLGKAARLAFMEARNAWVRPVPSVSGMPDGMEEGITQPAMARKRMERSMSNSTPSEISHPMRGAVADGAARRMTARCPVNGEKVAVCDAGVRKRGRSVRGDLQVRIRWAMGGWDRRTAVRKLTWTDGAGGAGEADRGGDDWGGGDEGHGGGLKRAEGKEVLRCGWCAGEGEEGRRDVGRGKKNVEVGRCKPCWGGGVSLGRREGGDRRGTGHQRKWREQGKLVDGWPGARGRKPIQIRGLGGSAEGGQREGGGCSLLQGR